MPVRAAAVAFALSSALCGLALAQPKIDVPPEEEAKDKPAPAPQTQAGTAPVQAGPAAPAAGGAHPNQGTTAAPRVERTSLFDTVAEKAAAIINRTVIGGYGEFVFNAPESADSYFEARRLVLFFYAPIHPRITFSTEVETEFGGTPRKVDGQLTGGEVILEFAVVDFKVADWLNLRGGVVLVPFGKFNVTHDAPTRDLTDRPLVLRTIMPSTWYEAGAGLFGTVRRGPFEVNYEAYVINGFDSKIQDGLGYRGARGSLTQDNNDDKAVVGRAGFGYFGRLWRWPLSVELGLSGYTGEYNRTHARASLFGADFTLRLGRLELLGEYVQAWNDAGFDDDYATSTRTAVPRGMRGFYVQANYHFMPQFLLRLLPDDLQDATFTAVAFYEEVDTDTEHDTAGDRTRLVFGLNFRPIEAVVWKHEVQFNYTGQVVDGVFQRRSFFGAGAAPRPSIDYVTSIAFLF